MRRSILALVVVLAVDGWASPSPAFVSPGYGRSKHDGTRRIFTGRWKLKGGYTAYEWEIGPTHTQIFNPDGTLATEGDWEYLGIVEDKWHVRLVRPGANVEYHASVDDKGELTLHVLETYGGSTMVLERIRW